VEFFSLNPGGAILTKTDVGGSDGSYDEAAHAKVMRGFRFYTATRANLKSESNKANVGTDLIYRDNALHKDWNAEDDTGRTGGKWLGHFYYTGESARGEDYGFEWTGHIDGVPNGQNHAEHWMYFHGIHPPGVLIKDFGLVRWCARTGIKNSYRPGEAGAYYGSEGLLHIENGTFEDMCLEQGGGGSYIDLSAHEGPTLIKDVRFLIGENPNLHPSLTKNITGMFVSDAYAGNPGGDVKFDGVYCRRGHAIRAGRTNIFLKEIDGSVTFVGCDIVDAPSQPAQIVMHTSMVSGPIIAQTDRSRNLIVGECVANGNRFKDPNGDGSGFIAMLDWLEANHPSKVVKV
jgi:hypothetical protein